ncbi:MAG TPA: DUF192 domain-containing protein [Myxococcales bacterium]|jgi:uncharacterized protein|nr:DUF192 domain-containing protein [Myxococcales bacterium]
MRRGPLFIALLLAGSCRGGASPVQGKDMPQPAVRFETSRGPWVVQVEVARTDEQRARGLMFRRDLPRDHGMLFLFDETSEHPFWMRNTLIALDMIFLGDDRRVVGVVSNAEPLTETPRTVGKPSRYVVEVSGGEAAAHAVVPGTPAAFLGIEE